MKYIIDIPKNTTHLNALRYEDGKCVSAMSYIIPDLIPYIELDREAIENETWDLANRIADMSYDDFISCFEGETEEYVYGLPYHEVKCRYEMWKKRKEEIHVGDEVNFGNRKGVVVRLADDGVDIVWSDGSTVYMDKADILKTGKFFEWVEEFMEKMRGEIG